MEKGICFFIKDFGYDSGVLVSLKHLSKILESQGIKNAISFYYNDQDLLQKVEQNANISCLNFHIPSFSDETLEIILRKHKNVVLSIHSTICNLQTEDQILSRLLYWGNQNRDNLLFTCPSSVETIGFNSILGNSFLYLPNTFWSDNLHQPDFTPEYKM